MVEQSPYKRPNLVQFQIPQPSCNIRGEKLVKALAEKHIHKFKRIKYKSGNMIFFCALPDCNHKMNTALALGKRSLCWRCGEPFIMNEYSIRLAKPHCENCHKPKNSITREEVTENSSISLADRLKQTIKQAQKNEEEEI